EAGIAVFGPNAEAAQIEGSKAFAKEVMEAAGVATARAQTLTPGMADADIERELDGFGPMYVVKDDGLAAGKGVVVTADRAAARQHIDWCMPLVTRCFWNHSWMAQKFHCSAW